MKLTFLAALLGSSFLALPALAAQPVTPTDKTGQYPQGFDTNGAAWVNCKTGCSGGTSSNAADGVATSSTNGQGLSWLYGFNGTTWDRLRSDASKYLYVDVATSVLPTGAATAAGLTTINTTLGSPFQAGGSIGNTAFGISGTLPAFAATPTFNCGTGCYQATQPVSAASGGFAAGALATGSGVDGWNLTEGAKADTAWTTGSGSIVAILKALDRDILAALPAGTNLLGKVGIDQTTVGTTNGVSLAQIGSVTVATGNGTSGTGNQRVNIASDNTAFPVNAQPTPVTSGGLSTYSEIVPNNTTSVAVKASAGQVYDIEVGSNSATPLSNPLYLKFYDAAQGSTTCGSGTPKARYVWTGGSNISIAMGEAYATAITLCVTGGIADADTTAPTASTYLVTIHYK